VNQLFEELKKNPFTFLDEILPFSEIETIKYLPDAISSSRAPFQIKSRKLDNWDHINYYLSQLRSRWGSSGLNFYFLHGRTPLKSNSSIFLARLLIRLVLPIPD